MEVERLRSIRGGVSRYARGFGVAHPRRRSGTTRRGRERRPNAADPAAPPASPTAPQAPFAQRLTPLRRAVVIRGAQFDRLVATCFESHRRFRGSGQGAASASVRGFRHGWRDRVGGGGSTLSAAPGTPRKPRLRTSERIDAPCSLAHYEICVTRTGRMLTRQPLDKS